VTDDIHKLTSNHQVIDEADRMMDEIKHDWLRYVEDAVYSTGGCDEFNESRCPVYGDILRLPPGPMTASR